jgi:hypothetical protein
MSISEKSTEAKRPRSVARLLNWNSMSTATGFAAASQGLAHGFWRAGSGVGAGEGGKAPVGSFLIDPGA